MTTLEAQEQMVAAIEGQNLYHGRYGTTPAGRATALAILAGLRHRGYDLAALGDPRLRCVDCGEVITYRPDDPVAHVGCQIAEASS